MKRVWLPTAAFAALMGLGAAGAVAANIAPPQPGVPVYGPVVATPPDGAVPPGPAPAGFEYRWVYAYDHHGYRGHWEAVRIGS
jgi:hypothetical protein